MAKTIVLAALLGSVALANEAVAESKWYNAEVVRAGVFRNGNVLCRMTDVSLSKKKFENQWFVAVSTVSQEVLRVCLTTMSEQLTVRFKADLNSGNTPVIEAIYMQVDSQLE